MKYIYTYDLHKLLKEELKNGSSDLVTKPSGQVVRNRIETDIAKRKVHSLNFQLETKKYMQGRDYG